MRRSATRRRMWRVVTPRWSATALMSSRVGNGELVSIQGHKRVARSFRDITGRTNLDREVDSEPLRDSFRLSRGGLKGGNDDIGGCLGTGGGRSAASTRPCTAAGGILA